MLYSEGRKGGRRSRLSYISVFYLEVGVGVAISLGVDFLKFRLEVWVMFCTFFDLWGVG